MPNTRSTLSKRTTRPRGGRSPGAFPNLVRNTRRRASSVGTRSRSSRRTIPSGVRHVRPACGSSFSPLSLARTLTQTSFVPFHSSDSCFLQSSILAAPLPIDLKFYSVD